MLTADLIIAEQLLNSADDLTPTQIHQDLAAVFVDLQNTFTDVCHLSAERSNAILLAVDKVKVSEDLLMQAENIANYCTSHLYLTYMGYRSIWKPHIRIC